MVHSSSRPNESCAVGFLRAPCPSIAALILLAACVTPPSIGPAAPRAPERTATDAATNRTAVIFVVKGSWHIDVGFPAGEMGPALAPLRAALPAARYILVGFGERRYLLGHGDRLIAMIGALFPSEGVLLVTGLAGTPQSVFGDRDAVSIPVTQVGERELELFVAGSLTHSASGAVQPLTGGPDDARVYFASPQRYSAFHTCNTWAAQALQAAGLPVENAGVEFASQLWRQVRSVAPEERAGERRVSEP